MRPAKAAPSALTSTPAFTAAAKAPEMGIAMPMVTELLASFRVLQTRLRWPTMVSSQFHEAEADEADTECLSHGTCFQNHQGLRR